MSGVGARQSRYLERLREYQVTDLVANGKGLSLDFLTEESSGRIVPLVVNDGRRGKASIFSPAAHYLEYPLFEITRMRSGFARNASRAAALAGCAAGELSGTEKVVYANHWLLSASPQLDPDAALMERILDDVRGRWPRHAVAFPGVVPAISPDTARLLRALGGRAVPSRMVYLLDVRAPARRSARRTRAHDARNYHAHLSSLTTDRTLLLGHVSTMQRLYTDLYIRKHSPLNPRYTTRFFALLLECEDFLPSGWIRDGILYAFNIKLVRNGVQHWSICGYDPAAPKDEGLFRLVTADDSREDETRVLNWGGGNPHFKEFRGAIAAPEYELVFDSHLPARRRIFWSALRELRSGRAKTAHSTIHVDEALCAGVAGCRVVLVTSIPEMLVPFLSAAPEKGVEIPAAVLVTGATLLSERLRDLPIALRKQARINRTLRLLQVANRVAYYRLAAEGSHRAGQKQSRIAALSLLQKGRRVIDASSANDAAVVQLIRRTSCNVVLVIGADVLTKNTIDAIGVPIVNLHMSDPAFVRGMPPVFWEIYEGRNEVTMTLHRLTPELDAGPVFAQHPVGIQWRDSLASTLAATREAMSREMADFLIESLKSIASGNAGETVVARGPLRTVPRISQLLEVRARFRKMSSS